jgi:UDP-3-O-[3-hydroxymyristoyl] N-acetylglucosamine deacetylase
VSGVFQHTLASSLSTTGVGLHTGRSVELTLHPAPPSTGIVFRKKTSAGEWKVVKSDPLSVYETRLCTCIGDSSFSIMTVEHVLSALCGMEIDNAYVDVDGDEIPIWDGSAASIVWLIEQAGRKAQNILRRYVSVKRLLRVETADGKWAQLEPASRFSLSFTIDFPQAVMKQSPDTVSFVLTRERYLQEIGRARTFGFVHEVEALHSQGLARGGSFSSAVVLDEFSVLNPEGLRYKDELVRHKVLDAIGDLYILGAPLKAAFSAYKSGHALNNQLLRALLSDSKAWEWVDC